MRKLFAIAAAALVAAFSAGAEEAVEREAEPAREVEARQSDAAVADLAAATLPGLFGSDDTAHSSLSSAELASAVAAYAGCGVVAGAIVSELQRMAASEREPVSPTPEPES